MKIKKLGIILVFCVFVFSGCEKEKEKNPFVKLVVPPNAKVCQKIELPSLNKTSFLQLPVKKRKKVFISFLAPYVLKVNCIIDKEREYFLKIKTRLEKEERLSEKEKNFLEKLKSLYDAKDLKELYLRVNTLPPSIVIAQGCIESAWGTSRFFLQGNNLFGIWSFDPKKEAIKAKKSNARVRKYPSVLYSLEAYYLNINTGWAYEELRKARLKTRNPFVLANYLIKYSVERERYVEKIKKVIRQNHLQRFDNCSYSNYRACL